MSGPTRRAGLAGPGHHNHNHEGNAVPNENDNGRREMRIAVPDAGGCYSRTDSALENGQSIRIAHNPGFESRYGDQLQYALIIPETVTAYIGDTQLTLTPEVWMELTTAISDLLVDVAADEQAEAVQR